MKLSELIETGSLKDCEVTETRYYVSQAVKAGSTPVSCSKRTAIQKDGRFSDMSGVEPMKCSSPEDCCRFPTGRKPLLCLLDSRILLQNALTPLLVWERFFFMKKPTAAPPVSRGMAVGFLVLQFASVYKRSKFPEELCPALTASVCYGSSRSCFMRRK